MKRLTDLDRMPSEDAEVVRSQREAQSTMPEKMKAYLKDEFFSGRQERRQKQQNNDRRRFLEMIGKAGVSTKMLQASTLLGGVMANRFATAQEGANKNVVFCYLNSGAVNGHWLPKGQGAMNIVTEPYADVAGICNFREVDVKDAGHSNPKCALGAAQNGGPGGPTMDARIAEYLGSLAPYHSLYLGSDVTGQLCSTLGQPETSPSVAYSKLFESPLPQGTADETYKSSYGAQVRAIQGLLNTDKVLSAEEKMALETHQESILKIQENLAGQLSGEGPDPSACQSLVAGMDTSHIVAHGKTQADIIVAAFACGLTKVATLQLGGEQGGWKGFGTNYTGDAHSSCHSVPDDGPNDELNRYLSQVPVYLIEQLRKVTGPDGVTPLINNTVFVQVTCMGNGRDHSTPNGPFVVATQMPGFKGTYSAMNGGTTMDLNGAIPVGMGIGDHVAPMGSSDLGLLS